MFRNAIWRFTSANDIDLSRSQAGGRTYTEREYRRVRKWGEGKFHFPRPSEGTVKSYQVPGTVDVAARRVDLAHHSAFYMKTCGTPANWF